MSTHTPGPWHVSQKPGAVGAISHANGFICFPCAPRKVSEERQPDECWLDMFHRTQPGRDAVASEQDANARLIASAPDLLQACRGILDDLYEHYDGAPDSRTLWMSRHIQDLNTAIAKANGGAK